jgi:hypothetical protein
LTDRNLTRLTPQTGYHPALDQAGEWLYFTKTRSGPSPLMRVRTDGSGQLEVAMPEVLAPYFLVTPVGTYFSKPDASEPLHTLFLRKPDGHEVELVRLPAPVADGRKFESSPDGRVIYVTLQIKYGTDLVLFDLK